jgi:hypothetical protein
MEQTTSSKPAARVPLRVAVRKDTWWVKPLMTALGLGFFIVWATFRVIENSHYEAGPYLSPFYSPLLPVQGELFGWRISPALFILPFPALFRATCYYYRQAYYRSFFLDPPACAVPEPSSRTHYHGERTFPLVLQNLHRYALYFALLFLIFLWYDTLKAFVFDGRFGMGLGSLIMLGNILLLSGYTFGCHSLRHLVGGRFDCFSCPMNGNQVGELRPGYGAWRFVSMLNRNHMQWAWSSLGSVILTDIYIRLVASGAMADLRFF